MCAFIFVGFRGFFFFILFLGGLLPVLRPRQWNGPRMFATCKVCHAQMTPFMQVKEGVEWKEWSGMAEKRGKGGQHITLCESRDLPSHTNVGHSYCFVVGCRLSHHMT